MADRVNLNIRAIFVLISLFLFNKAEAVPANIFDFNDGSVQGWTIDGAFDPEIDNITFPCNFTNGWNDYYNYPQPPGLDPSGNMLGSLQIYTPSDHGIDNPGGEWWVMQFHSPDLSTSESWQRASGYSVRIAECMTGGLTTLYANLFVRVYDLDLDRDRFFTNGVAVPLAYNNWSYHRHNWWSLTNFPKNYVIREVFVDIWGMMAYGSYLSGGVYLDNVIPIMPIYVDDDGGGPDEDGSLEHPFDLIQEGIDKAQSGEIVIVRDGTYRGEGNSDIDFLGKVITVHSENGPNTCTIDCEGTIGENHRGFKFHSEEDANSVLEGFTIINGFIQDGGGIYCDTNSSPSIINCVIRDCNAYFGAGIFCKNNNPIITNCKISNNGANFGGGIYFDGGDPIITNCTFNSNQASNHGGAICCYNSNPVITNCTIQGNSAINPIDSHGGGIYCNNGVATVNNCILWDNTAISDGPEIALADIVNPSELTISYSDVKGGLDDAYVEAGCTLNWGVGNINMDPCFVQDNYHIQSCSPCIDSGDPKGDYADQTDIDGYSRIFNARVDIGADEFSPLIYNVTQDTYHDTIQQAIDEAANEDTISIPDGIYTGPGNRDIHFYGKAITVRSENGPANCIIDCDGAEGEDDHRGFCFNHNEGTNSVLDGVTIMNGYCIIGGGIWCHYSNPTIINCIIKGNTANDDGGGILCSSYSSPTISNCTFIGNTAWGNGGAIACKEGGHATINNCTTSFNISGYGGGIYCNNSRPSLYNCVMWQDIASENGAEIALKSRYFPSTLTVSYSNITGGSDAAYVEAGCTLNWGQGNIDREPLLTPDGHLLADSPCIDAGDPNLPIYLNTPTDIDGDDRIVNDRIDIGSDEFIDTDGDRLPDWWEEKYFGGPNIADHNDDTDNDRLSNLKEYELYSSDPNTLPYYVDTIYGNDNYNGLSPTPQGDGVGPKKTIQAGIDVADNGDTVLVAAGNYSGSGNRWLDFEGKLIVLNAPEGPEFTTIDCDNVYTRAFNFHSGETPGAVVVGFTITNGLRNYGGAIVCLYSHPQIRNCIITNNSAYILGGGLYSYMSIPTLADCNITGNNPDGIWMGYGGTRILGTVELASNDWIGHDLMLTGDGILQIANDVTLYLDNSLIRCNLSGTGTLNIDISAHLIIDSESDIDFGDPCDPNVKGTIDCDGLLEVKDNAQITNANINITRARFIDDASVSNSVITVDSKAPYGQFFINDNVSFINNDIYADGDRYMNLDPRIFSGLFVNNRIFVTITEGVGQTQGGLFECRGKNGFADVNSCYPNNTFFCRANPGTIPDCNIVTWTLERLELIPGAKVNLTNRFPFQPPYDPGDDFDVVYVKELILRHDSVLNTSFNKIYYESLIMEPNAAIRNIPLLGFSMINIAFDDDIEFIARVTHNNFTHPNDPDYSRTHAERVEGLEPDQNGMMRMRNIQDLDPLSPYYQQVVNARAKGLFSKSNEDEILIWFEYLFETFDPNTELVIYLTDVPELMDHNDPRRADHYIEVAHLYPPPAGWPGSVGSGRFGTFQQYILNQGLNFIMGTRLEFELLGPDGTSILINNWDPQVHCSPICCADVTGDTGVTVMDFLTVVGGCGGSAELQPGGNSTVCLDGIFSTDGTVDSDDIASLDWMLNSNPEEYRCSLCCVPLTESTSCASAGVTSSSAKPLSSGLPVSLSDLIIAGKRGTSSDITKLNDYLYILDEQAEYIDGFEPSPNHSNTELIVDNEGELYQLNYENGLVRLSDGSSVVPSGTFSPFSEPRYSSSAAVYVGLHGEVGNWWGHPIVDAAFDSEGYLYVVPVVVEPLGEEPYTAAAKLWLEPEAAYSLVRLYDDPDADLVGDNRELNSLREIEVDDADNLYVVNSNTLNDSDILWKYDTETGVMEDRLYLTIPGGDVNIPAPIAMCLSEYDSLLYLASSENEPAADSCLIYGLSADTFDLERTITVNGMGHITSITENPETGTLWVAGFTMENIPEYLYSDEPPFYDPYIAEVPSSNDNVQAISLVGVSDLALPLSIEWTGSTEVCEGANLNNLNGVDFVDFAILANQWRQSPGNPSADIAPEEPDGFVDMMDLEVMIQYWLNDDCIN